MESVYDCLDPLGPVMSSSCVVIASLEFVSSFTKELASAAANVMPLGPPEDFWGSIADIDSLFDQSISANMPWPVLVV